MEGRRALQDLPVEDAQVTAELVALQERLELLAKEQAQRLVAIDGVDPVLVDQAELVEGVKRPRRTSR